MDETTAHAVFWDDRADAWDRHADAMEPFASQFGDPAIDRLDPAAGHHVADVGCGPGITTIHLAERVGPTGSATGIDVSARMVEAAGIRAAAAGVANVRFAVADPGAEPIGSFDGIFSRFGVMFFDEPATAFENVRRSLRSGGRFVAVVWAELDANPWMFLPTMFGAGPLGADLGLPGPGEPGPFSLADPEAVATMLETCGFRDVDVTRHEHAWRVDSASASDAIAQMLSVGALGEAWGGADDQARRAAVDAVRSGCEDFRDETGLSLPATALVYSATAGP